jgi:hypothetical protein
LDYCFARKFSPVKQTFRPGGCRIGRNNVGCVPADDEVAALRMKGEAEEKRKQQLNAELQSLQEIQRNQAHPLDLVVVTKNGTPVLTRPAVGSHPLFTAANP